MPSFQFLYSLLLIISLHSFPLLFRRSRCQSSLSRRFLQLSLSTVSEQIKVVTFNILAPCYKRLPIVADNIADKQARKTLEAEFEDLYLSRNQEIIQELIRCDADIICLQEY
jgi:mRNA deadenylase 3'-5' endonuclease subunit Ccr4